MTWQRTLIVRTIFIGHLISVMKIFVFTWHSTNGIWPKQNDRQNGGTFPCHLDENYNYLFHFYFIIFGLCPITAWCIRTRQSIHVRCVCRNRKQASQHKNAARLHAYMPRQAGRHVHRHSSRGKWCAHFPMAVVRKQCNRKLSYERALYAHLMPIFTSM